MHLIRGRLKCFGKEAKDSREAGKALDVNCDLVTEITTVAGYTKGIDEREKERKGMNMSVLIVSKNNFDTIKNSEKPVLLDFYADWCAPCRMMSPLVDEIAEENPQYLVGKINVDKEPELAQSFGVLSIPTLAVMKNGKVLSKSAGAQPKKQVLAMLEG